MESDKTARSLLETAIDIARLGTWRARPGASVFEASARCCALFGFDPSGRRMPVGETFDRIHEASRARVAAAYACIEREGGSYAERYRVKHPDGTVLWLDETARGEVGPDGQVVWLVGVVRDVTEEIEARRRADEAAVLFEEAVDGLLLVGADGIVRQTTPRAGCRARCSTDCRACPARSCRRSGAASPGPATSRSIGPRVRCRWW